MAKINDRSENLDLALDPDNPEDREIARRVKILADILELGDPGDALRIFLLADEDGQAAAQEAIDSWPDFSAISTEFRSESEQRCADLVQQMRSILRDARQASAAVAPALWMMKSVAPIGALSI